MTKQTKNDIRIKRDEHLAKLMLGALRRGDKSVNIGGLHTAFPPETAFSSASNFYRFLHLRKINIHSEGRGYGREASIQLDNLAQVFIADTLGMDLIDLLKEAAPTNRVGGGYISQAELAQWFDEIPDGTVFGDPVFSMMQHEDVYA